MKKFSILFGGCLVGLFLAGCASTGGNTGNMSMYEIPDEEAAWIRNGEPLVFEEGTWFPQDKVDILLDTEVSLVGKYREVEVFVDKTDVRPYARLYTKFGKNMFRIFKKANDPHPPAR